MVITYSKRLLGAMLKKEMRLKLSSKPTKVQIKLTHVFVPFVRKRSTSNDGNQLATSREKFRGMFIFFIKSEGGSVNGTVTSTKYRTSPIPAGGLEIPLLLTFSCSKAINFGKMKTFVQTLYDYNFNGTVIEEEENSDDEDEIIVINESDSRTVNNCIQLVGYSDSENEDKKQDRSEESNSEYEGENQDGSEESNSEDENENQGRNNIRILNYENEIEILLITE